MKKIVFTLCVLMMTFSAHAQKGIIIPRKFEFQKEANNYRLNELTKFLFEKNGFKAFWEDEIPQNLADRRCDLLFAKVTDDSNMFSTKLKVHLLDCQGTEVYVSEEGTTREKDYKTAYHAALREAFSKEETLVKFKELYSTKHVVPSEVEKLDKEQPKNTVREKGEVISEIAPEKTLPKIFAQKLKKGFYQLVDSTPKVVLKIYKTSIPNVFIAEDEQKNGVFYKEKEKYVYEYYQNGEMVKEFFDVKLD